MERLRTLGMAGNVCFFVFMVAGSASRHGSDYEKLQSVKKRSSLNLDSPYRELKLEPRNSYFLFNKLPLFAANDVNRKLPVRGI